ncbi:bifunctional 23S rRNA (guanine(2069)-N(7))-methyltransferase RlmK/23S rRNA (guanine(2445)-N(2))-methyltransferase RlmL [Candidatus Enterovibrio escicola]|uniref:Ribosomal RNA large subunit methyltransferase K/L n=1 Tax=Candidatus Enterovibrio escicola TaxID=1927127 RepID=A0A2A5T7A4_9GAMM|nr:bifunctional 23S rRNA (guanine(2069)-N(7))-methyltransferase RlmK/23S rRNA (guanine(2445)-N(2))-methyltransferase RlmL [Candidatus Enterovibrio escacola]PCS24041.1 23S rRNA (guanine-N-2-)-methyltransferase [Candidatus Enterovibrio escacola]
MNQYLAITSHCLENLLAEELEQLGASNIKPVNAGVRFLADQQTLYTCCLWSRTASRFIFILSEFDVRDDMDLYSGAFAINWPQYFSSEKRIIVDFKGTNQKIRNSQYGALKVKDAIIDCFLKIASDRPSIDREQPDLRIYMRLFGQKGLLGIDMVGGSLHQRGYRTEAGVAPLRETHAAGLVKKSGWSFDHPLFDPMCGSGTLLIEAAMMIAQIAPGLKRKRWSFESLKSFNREKWMEVHARATFQSQKNRVTCGTHFFGFDNDARVLEIAKSNAQRAGVLDLIQFELCDTSTMTKPVGFETGHIICNPPYGKRLGSTIGLISLYTQLGVQLKTKFKGSIASIYSGSDELLSCLRMRANSNYKLRNGALDCVMKTYQITARGEEITDTGSKTYSSNMASGFSNRLRKKVQKLDKWAKRQGIECYRLYDADLPEYNVAIDRYKDFIVIQEYVAPKEVPAAKARLRLQDIVREIINVTSINENNIIMKVREKKKGNNQYQKLSTAKRFLEVVEYGVNLEVNLEDYLDTGLFLDNRNIRKMLGEKAKGKDFLNLFGYTGTATVYAAVGGAKSTTTVDMSKTYLAWAERNMKFNGKVGRQHRFIQADCLKWLSKAYGQYGLIFIDPPTFSNSKRMKVTFDVQRDYLNLMWYLKRLLCPNGEIIFSNNKHNFKMNLKLLNELGLFGQNISERSIPFDFERNKQMHNCWIITHKDG